MDWVIINRIAVQESKLQTTAEIYALDYLSLLVVSGRDRVDFLQGQLTCDMRNFPASSSCCAAFCNAKGRVISTLLVIYMPEAFLLIMPADLREAVSSKLQRYIMRSAVNINQPAPALAILGCYDPGSIRDKDICSQLPGETPRYLCISAHPPANVENDSSAWRYQDIMNGFPWFGASQSELYTPQMLGIDRLGGVSFNKGCYTGQEIIARTHYLGKAKRSLRIGAYPAAAEEPEIGAALLDGANRQAVGAILNTACYNGNIYLLMVLNNPIQETDSATLIMDNGKGAAVNITALQ
ncbi:MAG: hypothetical protein ABSB19_14210 [Methylomonas sp.]|jgi:folate-binding protein YgfZ